MSLEFIHCNLSPAFVNAICGSLCMDSNQTHGIQHFSIRTSSFLEINSVSLPLGLESFLSTGRYLCSLNFRDNHLDRNFAQMLFRILIDAFPGLSTLDLSENNIAGWLSNFNLRKSNGLGSSSGLGKSLQSLRVLNVRGNNLHKEDAENLMYASGLMPNLEILDISDNPIEDDGMRCLIPHFIEAPERCSPLTELKLENCELSCSGVAQLLDTLSTSKRPLNSLSLSDNNLGSQVTGALARFLGTIKTLNIGDIGLGSAGFRELQKGMTAELKLVEINISKNRGGFETARFLSKLISLAPELIAVNATYNLMPAESLSIIGSALKYTKGKLQCLDLTGNHFDYEPTHELLLAEFHCNGKPILVFPSSHALDVPYDDDP
uniref:NACHT LRR and PYD domains-containing protein 13 isoform X4 n=1 Tax=Rhizophora mucronata TaxID=61149 RepID=A0A2P2LWK7_RHIMU